MPGPPPKENAVRQNKDTFTPQQVITVEQRSQAPELPFRDRYSETTLMWWETWCTSPQVRVFTETDWARLIMLAPMVERYWQLVFDTAVKPSQLSGLLAEIRQNESLLGATHADRLRGRIKVTVENVAGKQSEAEALRSMMEDYRRELES